MTKKIGFALLALALALAAGCGKKDSGAGGKGSGSAAAKTPRKPPPAPKAGALQPVASDNSVAFMIAKQPTWIELGFGCYQAALQFQPGTRTIDILAAARPEVGTALEAAGIDPDRDLMAVGGMSCAASMCMYAALQLSDPAQPKKLVDAMGASDVKTIAPDHYAVTVQAPNGPREIHLRFLPIDWTGVTPPDDERGQRARKATHVLFVSADDAGKPVPDPFTLLAAPDEAAKRLATLESMAGDARGYCLLGELAASKDFRPGFDLEHAQILTVTPPRSSSDALAEMMSVSRSLDVEIALDLSKAATKADVDGWLAEARTWFDGMAAQTPAPPAITKLLRTMLESAFTYDLKDKRVVLSWRTDRIPRDKLIEIDSELRALGVGQ